MSTNNDAILSHRDVIINDFKAISTRDHSICRCGARFDIGSLLVEYGALKLTVGITPDGVRWPYDIALPPAVARDLGIHIQREWLRLTGERWTRASEAR
jgi:hypothetical protein